MEVELCFLRTEEYTFGDAVARRIASAVDRALDQAAERLPQLSPVLSVTVVPTRHVIPELGLGAFTPSKDWIQLSVDPWDERGLAATVEEHLGALVVHEAHHAARWRLVPDEVAATTGWVLGAAVLEGLATVFQAEVTGVTPLWGESDPAVIDGWIQELLALPPGVDTRPWRFWHPDGRRWIAYRAGTRIAQRACASLRCTAAELVGTTNGTILDAAGVAPVRPQAVPVTEEDDNR